MLFFISTRRVLFQFVTIITNMQLVMHSLHFSKLQGINLLQQFKCFSSIYYYCHVFRISTGVSLSSITSIRAIVHKLQLSSAS